MGDQSFVRYEEKYVLSTETKERLMKQLKQHIVWDKHSQNQGEYTVYNVYCDTDDDAIVKYSLSHPPFKNKLRIRSYSPWSSDDEKVYLEMKSKYCGQVFKRRIELTLKEAKSFLNEGILPPTDSFLSNQILNEIAFYQSCYAVKPKVFLKYDRIAFNDKYDQGLRMTLDHRIQYHNSDTFSCQSECDVLLDADQWVFEIKSKQNFPLWLVNILSGLGLYTVRFSKINNVYLASRKEVVTECSYQL